MISIANLLVTKSLSTYPRPMEITDDHGSECIGHEFRKYLIGIEYEITAESSSSGNPTPNTILERIHQVIGNLVQNFNIAQIYISGYYPCSGILSVAAFSICSTTN